IRRPASTGPQYGLEQQGKAAMDRKKILITKSIAEPVLEQAHALFDVAVGANLSTPQAAADALHAYDAILVTLGDAFTAETFALAGKNPRCRMLGNFGVGYNHIDTAAAAAHGVAVSNTPDVLTDATADIGWTLILSTARRTG